jgi:hypothetical protein
VLIWYVDMCKCRCTTYTGIAVHQAVATMSGRTPTVYGTASELDATRTPRDQMNLGPTRGKSKPRAANTSKCTKTSRSRTGYCPVVRRRKGLVSLCLAQILAPPLCASSSVSWLACKGVAVDELVMPARPPGSPESWNLQRGRTPVRNRQQRRDHYPQDEFYDTFARTKRIPRERWTTGEAPRSDKVHVDMYVFGRSHGGLPDDCGTLDGSVTVDEDGSHPMEDRDRSDTYREQRGFDKCDGNNKFVRRRMLEFLRGEPAGLLALVDLTIKRNTGCKEATQGEEREHCSPCGQGSSGMQARPP